MTATLPDGMEYKNLTAACVDAPGVWGSQFPEEDGVRNLIVAVTGVRDEVGDIIVPGAFEHTLRRIEPKGCMGHDWNRVTGYPEAIEEVMPGDPRLPRTDRFGKPWPAEAGALFVRHRYHTDTEDGARAYKDARFLGPRLACSIGYVDPKDDNGTPLHSYKAVDPVSGLMTRFLPRLDLFEYSQVLHGAHLLAGGLKDGKPKRLERKRRRPDMELKIRLVRDSAYWGLPLGTPIRPGMKPQGPKARRLVAAGQQATENAGAVEVDANNLRVKSTAKGKQKGDVAIEEAYSGILGLIDEIGYLHDPDDKESEITPFNPATFQVEDGEHSINNGEMYNPLDILVANAIPPAEVEEDLRNADWDTDRLGDAAERQDEIDSYVADVVDAYREKYNAELVRQNDTGDSEVAEPSDEGTEVQPETAGETSEADARQVRADRLRAGDKFTNPDNGNVVTVETARPSTRPGEMVVQGTDSEGGPFDAVLRNDDMLPAAPAENAAEQAPADVQPDRPARQQQADGEAPAPSLEDGRTMQAAEPADSGELQAFELTGDNGATLRVYKLRRPSEPGKPWAYDIIGPDGEMREGEGLYQSPGSALVRAEGEFHDAERGDTSVPSDQNGQTTPSPAGDAAEPQAAAGVPEMAKPGDPIQPPAEALPANADAASEPSVEDVPKAPSGESTVEPGLAPDAAGEPPAETDPALAGEPLPEEEAAPELTEEITPDEIADTEESVDASFGVTEAPDGEFEVDADIADRQDRVASLLVQSEQGSLDLSGSSDDQLRGTRADIVDELRLQQHLERRRNGEHVQTRQQAEAQAGDSLVPQEEADDTAVPEETGPKLRPGVAGAAEDLADALESGSDDRIDAAVDRFRKALTRSRSDSPIVEELRAMLAPENGGWDAAALRDAAERLRDEQRAKRNEGARRRRAARRFERERLRALLSQVEAEMRNRDLDFDPIPDDDGTVTLDLDASAPVTWSTETRAPDWANTSTRVDTLTGSGYTATISTYVKPDGSLQPSEYRWTVTGDDSVVLASGSGTASDPDSARAAVEIALDTQRRLGLIPIDAQIPQGSVPQHTSATPLAEVVDAIGMMRARLADGRQLNPITGEPDPFADEPVPLPVPERSRFADVDAVRKHLEMNGPPSRTGNAAVVNLYRWDTAKMTPGGAFVVVDDLKGKPQIVHTVSGGSFDPPLIAGNLGRADLLRYAEIVEVLPDRDGRTIDWNLKHRELMDDMQQRNYDEGTGVRALQEAAVNRLTREKIHARQFTHKLVQRGTTFINGVTNDSRERFAADQHHTLNQLINVARGKPDAFNRKTLDIANSARTLAAMGAPDAAAVLLTRRAAEIREQHPDSKDGRGAAVLDSMARGYLAMFSPMRSHGERIGAIKAGERVFLVEKGEDGQLRSFRALSAPRRDPRGGPSDQIVPVIDEKTGDQKFLHIIAHNFRIEDTEQRTYGYAPLGEERAGGLFAVVGPGEEPPATEEDLRARQFSDADAIPQDVLDAAAEVLPENAAETSARRAAAPEGGRAPRRRSPAAPRRTAPQLAAPEPVTGEQHLAQAQGRVQGRFLGMPFEYGGAPERGSFDSVEAVREHLLGHTTDEGRQRNPQLASTANATIGKIDRGEMKLSPGGAFLVDKGGSVTHASTGFSVWPPSNPAARTISDDLHGGGYAYTQAAGLRVARALESGVFDGEQIDWSGDGKAAIKQTNAISARNGKFHPIQTAQRAAYLDAVLGITKPTKTDIAMFTGMVNNGADLDGPNPEAFDRSTLIDDIITYEGSRGFLPNTKAGANLAKQVAAELRMVEPLAKTAPLDAVRRLTRLADQLDGQTITTSDPELSRTPSNDLRKAASMITDVYDPDKISESGRFRRAGMVGQVELTKPRITAGRTWKDSNGVGGREVERQIRDAGGIRFYRDENGMLHATFAGVDIADAPVQVGGGTTGAIKLSEDGRLTLSYLSANRLIVIEAPPRSWKFTLEEEDNGGDIAGDISGPEIDSAQVEEGAAPNSAGDIEKDMPDSGTESQTE